MMQIQFLEGLLGMWFEYERSVHALKSWMANQEDRLKKKHRMEDLTSVQNALKECQVGLFSRFSTTAPFIYISWLTEMVNF